MIEKGTCKTCSNDGIYVYSGAGINSVCANCLECAAIVTLQHHQGVAAAHRDLGMAADRVFKAILTISQRTHGAPMTLAQIGEEIDRGKTAVWVQIDKLIEAGLVTKNGRLYRAIQPVRDPSLYG